MKRYFAKPDTWFKEGTEVEVIVDCRNDPKYPMNIGLFSGIRDSDGLLDEEQCSFDEFDEVEDSK